MSMCGVNQPSVYSSRAILTNNLEDEKFFSFKV